MKKISAEWFAGVSLIITVTVAGTALAGHAAPGLAAWRWNGAGQRNVPSELSNVAAISTSTVAASPGPQL